MLSRIDDHDRRGQLGRSVSLFLAMRSPLPLALVALLYSIVIHVSASPSLSHPSRRDYDAYDYFVLEHDPTVPLRDVLDTLRLEFVDQVGQLRDHWLLRRPRLANIQNREVDVLDALVRKRSLDPTDQGYGTEILRVSRAVKHIARQVPRRRVKRDDASLREPQAGDWTNMTSKVIADREGITDPLFGEQWHLVNDENPVHMVNVAPVWVLGISGQGIISALVDDGLDFESDDLAPNFVSRIMLTII